jgi:hypothetical protein
MSYDSHKRISNGHDSANFYCPPESKTYRTYFQIDIQFEGNLKKLSEEKPERRFPLWHNLVLIVSLYRRRGTE